MTIPSLIAAACFITSVFFSIVSECLQNFLRSRLAVICRERENMERFRVILRDDEAALLATSACRMAALIAAVLVGSYARYSSVTLTPLSVLSDLVCVVVVGWMSIRVLPWSLSRTVAERILFTCWPLIHAVKLVFQPFLSVTLKIDTVIHRMAGMHDPVPENYETLTDEIQSVVVEGERDGILGSTAGKMIYRVMELRSDDVRAIMTPRTDIITLPVESSLEDARLALVKEGFSRVPVVDGSSDNILGILYARDLLEHLNSEQPKTLQEIIREPIYIPETTLVHDQLEKMRAERLHMAIVLDEYGGVTGLVTLEDILEEIVGEIDDEFDDETSELVEKIDPNTLWIDGRMRLDDLNDRYELDFPEDHDFDTIGGLVFSEVGRVPKKGERFNWKDVQITVLESTDRQVNRLELSSAVPWETAEHSSTELNGETSNQQRHRLTTDKLTAD